MSEKNLTTSEVADELNCARSFVYKLVSDGKIRHFRAGNAIRIPESALREFIEQNTVPMQFRDAA